MTESFSRDGYEVSTDPARLDAAAVHAYLSTSYWALDRTLQQVTLSLRGSLCFGLYKDGRQVGLARAITDGATSAFLCDIYVLAEHRGRGLGKLLMSCVLGCKTLAPVKHFSLRTTDAHGLYRHFGFSPLKDPERSMTLSR